MLNMAVQLARSSQQICRSRTLVYRYTVPPVRCKSSILIGLYLYDWLEVLNELVIVGHDLGSISHV